jgi:glycosyltransferase involved in cell wall biosynthesis
MFFTILIASKNEEKDIHLAIKSSLMQSYKNFEIVIVDDSEDQTKKIIKSYKSKKIRLIDGDNKGCCQARNKGIKFARGQIIVFLTADTKLNKNYLKNLVSYYKYTDIDIVMCRSLSFNLKSVYSRFVEMQYRLEEKSKKFNPYTTQGYSVRKKKAIQAGGITGGNYSYNFCRDWTLVKKMEELGCKKIVDRNIVVKHKSPDNLKEYWYVRKTRGLMSAFQPYYMFNKSINYLFFKFLVKDFFFLLKIILIIPYFYQVYKIYQYSSIKLDIVNFIYAKLIQDLSFIFGEWQGMYLIIKKKL